MYYGMIMGAVLMFGISFFFNERYQKHSGSDLIPTMQFSLISAIAGAGILFAVNRFALAVTPFTVLMALANSLNGLLFTFCSLKALGKINLSLYSLFSMLGGMALPFVGGILSPGQGFLPEYDAGLYQVANTQLIVSRGLGNSRFPFRINNRPEIVLAVLN
jgi:hypothetical protein